MANYILFDDQTVWEDLLPLTYTRPVSEIRTGILKISEKWSLMLNADISFYSVDYLSQKYPAVLNDENIYINSGILPDSSIVGAIQELRTNEALVQQEKLIALNGNLSEFKKSDKNFRLIPYKGNIKEIRHLWDIFLMNGSEIIHDFELITKGRLSAGLSQSNRITGKYPVFAEDGVKCEYAIFNTENGPVYLGRNSVVMEGSLIQGPFALCESAQIKMGAKIYPDTTIGPHCRAGGELNNVVFLGYSNKAHDGFLGNAVIGEWCNIGADSNNSNLKNTYKNVKVWNYRQKTFINSGLQFCGLFMGDHSKCGINTMFNTGTSVGVSANIFGAGFPRTFIPSFSWGGHAGFTTYKIEKAFESMEAVMLRRNCRLSDTDKSILSHIFEITKEFRI